MSQFKEGVQSLVLTALDSFNCLFLKVYFDLDLISNDKLNYPVPSAIESCPCRYRGLMGMLLGLPYTGCVVIFAGICYLIRKWQIFFLAATSPVLLLIPFTL